MADNADYRVNATDGSFRAIPLSDKESSPKKKGPSSRKKRTAPKAKADENIDQSAEGNETKIDKDHLLDYYA